MIVTLLSPDKLIMNHLRVILLLLSITGFNYSFGQPDSTFKPAGKPVFLIFSNVHSFFNREGFDPGFEITRLYLGYEYAFTGNLSARANIDIGDPGTGGLEMTAYVKHAYLMYNTHVFSGRIGMISTDQFNLIDKQWGYRYIFKTLQDQYGFGSSADLGMAIEYRPSEIVAFDASVLNGEGYKRLQSDSIFKYTFGITLKPVRGLLLRGYTDFMKKDNLQNSISLFAGYTFESFNTGLEYSIQKNHWMRSGMDLSGVSAFASFRLSKKFSLLARYDQLWSSAMAGLADPWNYDNDGELFMAGFEFAPVKGIRIAPVFTGWLPADNSQIFTSRPGIYFELKL